MESLVEVFSSLLAQAHATVVVPDLATIDEDSQMLLRGLCREGFDRVIVGLRGNGNRDPVADQRGLLWRMNEKGAFRIAAALLRTPGVVVHELHGRDSAPTRLSSIPCLAPEDACYARIADGQADDAALATCLAVMRARFRAFGNFSALKLGLALLAHGDRLADPDRADVLEIVALCAHNRQFRSAGNLTLGAFILSCTKAALEIETRPAMRCALFYRLAVTLGRRLGQLEEAEAAATLGVEAVAQARMGGLLAAYLGGWCHNIRAYARMRRKDKAGAERDVYLAASQLRPFAERPEAPGWKVDVQASAALFASGVSTLRFMRLELDDSAEWRALADQLEPEHPGAARFTPVAWISLHQAQHRPDLALARVEDGLKGSRLERDGLWEYRYLVLGADLAFRLGRLDQALAFFEDLRSLHRLYGGPSFLVSPELPSVAVYVAAGKYDCATAILSSALQGDDLSLDGRAEIHLWLARIAAARLEPEAAEAQANLAIDGAVSGGRLDTLMVVASTAGDIAMALGRPEEAREAYARTLELCTQVPADKLGRHGADWLRALIGRAEVEGPLTTSPAEAIRLVPAALHQAQGWWLLPRLLRWLATTGRDQGVQIEGDGVERGFDLLRSVAPLREDCTQYLHSLFGAEARSSVQKP